MSPTEHHDVLIAGGGTAGITVAARLLRNWFRRRDVAVIEPGDTHYYQPLWTLVGAGVVPREQTARPMSQVMPRRARWIRDAVTEFQPDANRVLTRDGRILSYNGLVVAMGLQPHWEAIPGLREHLTRDGVCSNYAWDTVNSTWETLRNFSGGTAIFTQPSGPIRCGGAPQKIMYLADDYLRKIGVRERSRILFAAPMSHIFGIEPYRKTLEDVIRRKGIECLFRHELVEIADDRVAVFRHLDTGELTRLKYDMLHVTPKMGPPECVKSSPLADAQGFVDVDPGTLQHRRYASVFSLGDCASLPTAKTGAAVRKQAPVLVRNLLAAAAGRPLTGRYNGYSSCPLVTGYGRVVLAEFDYEKKPAETFPFDQSQERWSMWMLKRWLLPQLYWHGMLKGWL